MMVQPLNKFQHNYYLKEQESYTGTVANDALRTLVSDRSHPPQRRLQGVYTLPESLHEYNFLDNIEVPKDDTGFYTYTLPRAADACYNIEFVFEEGEECDVFLFGQNITNMFTKRHPLYLVPLEWSVCPLKTKNKPIDIYVNWIFLADDERLEVYSKDMTTVNAIFTTFYSKGFIKLYGNEHFKELHFVAKRIQKWYKKYSIIQQTKRYLLACRLSIQRELIYLPPWDGGFAGGIVYQNAMENFDTLKNFKGEEK